MTIGPLPRCLPGQGTGGRESRAGNGEDDKLIDARRILLKARTQIEAEDHEHVVTRGEKALVEIDLILEVK